MKTHNGQPYTGAPVGYNHHWHYNDCEVHEEKIAPDIWRVTQTATKGKHTPGGTGGPIPGTKYHWFWIADQHVIKKDKDHYDVIMHGIKYKLGHKRPHWRTMSYEYPNQLPLKQRTIQQLKHAIKLIENNTFRTTHNHKELPEWTGHTPHKTEEHV